MYDLSLYADGQIYKMGEVLYNDTNIDIAYIYFDRSLKLASLSR